MIIFLADGGLGNQIFQYAFLKTIQKNNEKIIVSGFEDLQEVFEIDDIVNLNNKNRWIRAFVFRIVKPIFNYLSDKNVISSIAINHEQVLKEYRRETITYNAIKGFISSISFVKSGFFQSEKFFNNNLVKTLIIKDKYIKKADDILKQLQNDYHKVFIHVRRGDYKDFKIYGKSALLPMNYYKKQIAWFLQNKENCFFIFISDSLNFKEKEFDYLVDNKLILYNNHYGTDLAIMTKCKSAILSPSSFCWWGSYLMRERDTVFAPKYWLGFNSSIEFQLNCIAEFMNEVNIK